MHKTPPKTRPKPAQDCTNNTLSPVGESVVCVQGSVQSNYHRDAVRQSVSPVNKHRDAVRQSINRADPGLLAFLDLAKTKFPASRLEGVALKAPEGWQGLGCLVTKEPGNES